MTDPGIDQVIGRYLNGTATADDLAVLDAALIADRRVALAFMQMARIDAGLRTLCRQPVMPESSISARLQAARRVANVQSARHRPRPRRSFASGWLVILVVAASLLIVVSAWVQLNAVPIQANPPASDAVAAQPITSFPGREMELSGMYQVPGGGTVALNAGTRARAGGTPQDPLIVLDTGTIECEIAKRAPGTSFRVQTAHGMITVVGTRFQVAVGDETRVSVTEGTVAVASAGGRQLVQAGAHAYLATGSTPLTFGPVVTVIDNQTPSAWNAQSTGATVAVAGIGPTGQPAMKLELPGDYGWMGVFWTTKPQDWSRATGVSLVFRGLGSGRQFLFELLDNQVETAPAKERSHERFTVKLTDSRAGWQEVRIPFADFKRRALQLPGAPDDGLTLTSMSGITLIGDAQPMQLEVERIAIY